MRSVSLNIHSMPPEEDSGHQISNITQLENYKIMITKTFNDLDLAKPW